MTSKKISYHPRRADPADWPRTPRVPPSVSARERWVDIQGYEGSYKISNYGRLLACSRTVYRGGDTPGWITFNGGEITPTPYIPKPGTNQRGHYSFSVSCDGIKTRMMLHRQVAIHFVHNPSGNPRTALDYRDDDWRNVFHANLIWSDRRVGHEGRTVRFRDPEGVVHEAASLSAMAREHGLHQSALSLLLSGVYLQHHGWTRA